MPVGIYECDYCNKEFKDTPSARRRHLLGVQHQRAKALWFDSFKDPNQVNSQGFGVGVCNRFVRTGFCQYGDSCKYFHPKQNVPVTIGQGNSQEPIFLVNQVVVGGSLPECDTQEALFKIEWVSLGEIYLHLCNLLPKENIHLYPLLNGDKVQVKLDDGPTVQQSARLFCGC